MALEQLESRRTAVGSIPYRQADCIGIAHTSILPIAAPQTRIKVSSCGGTRTNSNTIRGARIYF